MKFKKLMIVGILLLAILAIGAVSANGDVNQTLGADDAVELITDDGGEAVIGDGNAKEDISSNVGYSNIPTTVLEGGEGYDGEFSVDMPSGEYAYDGNISASVDGKEVYNDYAREYDNEISSSLIFDDLSFGSHKLNVRFFNDAHYADFAKTFDFQYVYYTFQAPTELDYGQTIGIDFAGDVSGYVKYYLDGEELDEVPVDGYTSFSVAADKLGKHNYKLVFKSDDGDTYPSFTKSGSFNMNYRFSVSAVDTELSYGTVADVDIYLPYDAIDKVKVAYNGKTKSYVLDEDGYVNVKIDGLKMGENKVTFTYSDKKYSSRTKEIVFTVTELLDFYCDVPYKSGKGMEFRLPEDAKGKLNVTVDGVSKLYSLEKGTVSIDMSNYDMKFQHEALINYTGDDYAVQPFEYYFNVVANFDYSDDVWVRDGFKVSVSLPNDANGTIFITDSKIIQTAKVVNGKATLTFKTTKAREFTSFRIGYEGGNYPEYDGDVEICVHDSAPNSTMTVNVPEIILSQNCEDTVYISCGDYISGNITVYIDGKYVETYFLDESSTVEFYFSDVMSDFKIGNHTIKVDYSGDDYYLPSSYSTTFRIDYYKIDLTDKVILYDDYAMFIMNTVMDAQGSAVLEIDGKKINAKKYDSVYNFYIFDLSGMDCGQYDAKLVYTGDKTYKSFTKDLKVNIVYNAFINIDDGISDVVCGEDINVSVEFTVNVTGNVVAELDGKECFSGQINNSQVEFTIKDMALGDHNITVKTMGDDKYPASEFNEEFTVFPAIQLPYRQDIVDQNKIYLNLPADAKGSLKVTVYAYDDDSNPIKEVTKKLSSGKAVIALDDLKLGQYKVEASYIGDDYPVDDMSQYLIIQPKVTYCDEIYVDQEGNVTVELPSDAKGVLTIKANDKELDVTFKNGIGFAKYSNLENEDLYLYISYTGDSKYGSFPEDYGEYYILVKKYDANITGTPQKEIIANNYIDVAFTLPSDATGTITFEDGKTGTVKNGKATAKAFVPKAGENILSAHYSGDDRYNDDWIKFNVTALKAPTLTMKAVSVYYTAKATFKVKVVDSYGKIVKGGAVTFYVNGKKVKSVKTNSKGYATIKLSKIPGTYKVKVAYKGGVVTKKLTVKHLLSLKTVKVKKSAKKLVLTATLKKGKKALKGKTVKFKFKGKTYKAKTNKNGVAKVTIKKSALKKLKVGKTVKYQATYLKDIVKKSAKVKK